MTAPRDRKPGPVHAPAGPKRVTSIEERRARREARRERQRAENVVRAKEMHTARLASDRERGEEGAAKAGKVREGRAATPETFIGCSGWFYWHWRDGF